MNKYLLFYIALALTSVGISLTVTYLVIAALLKYIGS